MSDEHKIEEQHSIALVADLHAHYKAGQSSALSEALSHKQLDPYHLLKQAKHIISIYMGNTPEARKKNNDFISVEEIISRALQTKNQNTLSAVLAVFEASNAAENKKSWFKNNHLYSMLRQLVQDWYAENPLVFSLEKETQNLVATLQSKLGEAQSALEALKKETPKNDHDESELRAQLETMRTQIENMTGQLEEAERTRKRLEAQLATAEEDAQSVYSAGAQSTMSFASSIARQIQLDARQKGPDGKAPQSYKPAFYLYQVVKQLESKKNPIAKADAASIETAYMQLRPFILHNAQGIVQMDASHPRYRFLKNQLDNLAILLDTLAKEEALEYHDKKNTVGYQPPKFDKTIINCLLNLYKKGGSLFETDTAQVKIYHGYWHKDSQESGLLPKKEIAEEKIVDRAVTVSDNPVAFMPTPSSRSRVGSTDQLANPTVLMQEENHSDNTVS